MLTIRHVHDGTVETIPIEELPARREAGGFLWVDLEAPTDAEEEILHHPAVALDPMVIEDMREDRHLPKLEVLADQIALTVHSLHVEQATVELDTLELDIALKDGLLVTFHEERIASVAHVAERLDRTGAARLRRPVQLLHLLLDVMNDVFVPFLDLIEQRLDWIEEDLMTTPSDETRREIYALQRDVIQLRRAVVPQAEVIRRLGREPVGLVDEEDTSLFRDVYDHLYRMAELSESYRQLLDSAMDTYRSQLDDDLNQMLNVLTLISALLLPISVLAGIYGMNFEFMPELEWRYGYFALWGVFLAIVGGMLVWFRRRGWLGRRRDEARWRRRVTQVLEVPVLGKAMKMPAYGARAVALTGRGMVRLPRRLARLARQGVSSAD